MHGCLEPVHQSRTGSPVFGAVEIGFQGISQSFGDLPSVPFDSLTSAAPSAWFRSLGHIVAPVLWYSHHFAPCTKATISASGVTEPGAGGELPTICVGMSLVLSNGYSLFMAVAQLGRWAAESRCWLFGSSYAAHSFTLVMPEACLAALFFGAQVHLGQWAA